LFRGANGLANLVQAFDGLGHARGALRLVLQFFRGQKRLVGRFLVGIELSKLGCKGGKLLPMSPRARHGAIRELQRHQLLLRLGEFYSRPGIARALEETVETVVVLVRERVELVVVATATIDGQAQERSAQVVDGVLDREMPRIARIRKRSKPAGICQVSRRD